MRSRPSRQSRSWNWRSPADASRPTRRAGRVAVKYAPQRGMRVHVYSNLVHVTPELWDLLDEVREMRLREGSLPAYGVQRHD